MADSPERRLPDLAYGGAQSVALFMTANGATIEGESTVATLGREDSIECIYFVSSVTNIDSRPAGVGVASGRRQHAPIVVRKRVDKSTPRIMRALVQNEAIDATFRFYRPHPSGDGTEEQFFTIEIEQGRVVGQTLCSPDNVSLAGQQGWSPLMEEVSVMYRTIRVRSEDGGIEFEDNWTVNR